MTLCDVLHWVKRDIEKEKKNFVKVMLIKIKKTVQSAIKMMTKIAHVCVIVSTKGLLSQAGYPVPAISNNHEGKEILESNLSSRQKNYYFY